VPHPSLYINIKVNTKSVSEMNVVQY